jgi:hypothetical protein
MTPEQHRRAAKQLRLLAGKPGAPDQEKAERLANSHEHLAQVIERRLKPN